MSELKAFDVGLGRYLENGSPCVVAFDADQNPRLLNEKVYLKDEADKVIAEKDKEIRHHKYRRCLAMAMWCYDRWIRAYNLNKIDKTIFYVRWQKRWLELAKKFKPNNSTLQQKE